MNLFSWKSNFITISVREIDDFNFFINALPSSISISIPNDSSSQNIDRFQFISSADDDVSRMEFESSFQQLLTRPLTNQPNKDFVATGPSFPHLATNKPMILVCTSYNT